MKNLWKNFFLMQPRPDPSWTWGRKIVYFLYRWGMVLCAGVCMGLILLTLAVGTYPREVLDTYFRDNMIMILNTVPVVVLIFLLYGVLGSAWSAFLLGGGVAYLFSLGDFFKLAFRDDPFYFEDLLIIGEAKNMATSGHYTPFLNTRIVVIFLCLLLGAVALRILVPGRNSWRSRITTTAVSLAAAAALTPVYLDEDMYASIRNFDELNEWSVTQNYISRGFVYPFLHSVGTFMETLPKGYNDSAAKTLLAGYSDADIPEDRKISVIALMREAYVDFSQYDVPGLDASGYDLYHQLESESYTGNLVTNIFAGGTVNTERSFLTGNYQIREYHIPTNSYVWYLRSQGYIAEGSHPYYHWFYNRTSVNSYLGFQRYRFLEDDYRNLTSAWYPEDSVLLPEIYKDFKAANGAPYFSFSVNVQSHGPYNDPPGPSWGSWLAGDYSDECKNAVNQYLTAILDTDKALAEFLDRLREDPSPVVVVTFGDHMPWMGDGNAYYHELGLDIEGGSDESFYLRYSTRYLIWANNAAKELIGYDVQGEGPDISPCYLMNLVFNQLGWKGPGFMQAMEDMRQVFSIPATTGRVMTDGVLSSKIPDERQKLYQDFRYLQYYWRNVFLYEDVA